MHNTQFPKKISWYCKFQAQFYIKSWQLCQHATCSDAGLQEKSSNLSGVTTWKAINSNEGGVFAFTQNVSTRPAYQSSPLCFCELKLGQSYK